MIQIRACPFSMRQGQLQLTFLEGYCTSAKNIMYPAAHSDGVHLAKVQ